MTVARQHHSTGGKRHGAARVSLDLTALWRQTDEVSHEEALLPSGILAKLDAAEDMPSARMRVIDELLQTEQCYVAYLETAIDVFYCPLLKRLEDKKPLVSKFVLHDLFSEMVPICNINGVFLEELEQVGATRLDPEVHRVAGQEEIQ